MLLHVYYLVFPHVYYTYVKVSSSYIHILHLCPTIRPSLDGFCSWTDFFFGRIFFLFFVRLSVLPFLKTKPPSSFLLLLPPHPPPPPPPPPPCERVLLHLNRHVTPPPHLHILNKPTSQPQTKPGTPGKKTDTYYSFTCSKRVVTPGSKRRIYIYIYIYIYLYIYSKRTHSICNFYTPILKFSPQSSFLRLLINLPPPPPPPPLPPVLTRPPPREHIL